MKLTDEPSGYQAMIGGVDPGAGFGFISAPTDPHRTLHNTTILNADPVYTAFSLMVFSNLRY